MNTQLSWETLTHILIFSDEADKIDKIVSENVNNKITNIILIYMYMNMCVYMCNWYICVFINIHVM